MTTIPEAQAKTIVFTGMSGAGKTTALRAVEDLGFYCVDNLPLPLLDDLVGMVQGEVGFERIALVVDARLRQFIDGYDVASVALRQSGRSVEVVYLDGTDEVLMRRFSQTRRRHPLSSTDLRSALDEERRLLAPLKAQANVRIDTTDLTLHQLKRVIQDRYRFTRVELVVQLMSFGFRYGVPSYADVMFDARFLPNPFFVDTLRPQTGRDAPVANYVFESEDAREFLERMESMMAFLLPRYRAEGKAYLTVAVGCTGGRHRSVALCEALAKRLGGDDGIEKDVAVSIRHRDVEK